jgi:hypothetical protein
MPSSRPTSASGKCAGQEPTPSPQAATIMFCAQRPASNSCFWVWAMTIVAAECAMNLP